MYQIGWIKGRKAKSFNTAQPKQQIIKEEKNKKKRILKTNQEGKDQSTIVQLPGNRKRSTGSSACITAIGCNKQKGLIQVCSTD